MSQEREPGAVSGMMLELALLPPVLRFFIALVVILTGVPSVALFLHWIGKGEEGGD